MGNGFSEKEMLWVVSAEDYEKWVNNEYLYCGDADLFDLPLAAPVKIVFWLHDGGWYSNYDFTNADDILIVLDAEYIYTYEEFFEQSGYETFEEEFTLSNGQEVVAFGYRKIDDKE